MPGKRLPRGKVEADRASGLSQTELARGENITQPAVSGRERRAGLPPRQRGRPRISLAQILADLALSRAEVAKRDGITPKAVTRREIRARRQGADIPQRRGRGASQ